MGIPYYYKHILQKYKNIITEQKPRCDAFYIDYNSVIHQCAYKVTNEHPKTYTHKMIIDEVIATTRSMIERVKPTKYVYIGIDGVAPRAKMMQQRKRRYITAYRHKKLKDIFERHMYQYESTWDSNIITPGTEFMKTLNTELKKEFNHPDVSCDIIISDSDEKGEGEQKVFDHLRSNQDVNLNVIISGLDADLIMLSLLSRANIFLQRDDITYVDINFFRKCISHHLSNDDKNISYMYDYVFLCFFLGNDFLPGIPYLKIRDGAIDMIIKIYKECFERLQVHLIRYKDGEFTVNSSMLLAILQQLSESENENMKYAVQQHISTAPQKNMQKIEYEYPKAARKYIIGLEYYPIIHKHPLLTTLSTQNNPAYYKQLFGSNEASHVTRYCEKYIDGLMWTVNYYFNRKYDDFWYYKHTVTPLCTDIYNTLISYEAQNNQTLEKRRKSLTTPSLNINITPELQLLCVLPIQSINCIPPKLRPIITDPLYGCMHYYPIEYTLCTFMKKFLWECSPIIPDIDISYLAKVYSQVIQ